MTSQQPRRRHSPAVYRRRRLTVLLVLILIVAGVWLAIAQPWSSKAAATKAPPPAVGSTGMTALPVPTNTTPPVETPAAETPAETTASTPTAEPTAKAVATAAPCTSANVSVDAVTDQTTFPGGQNPKFSIRLTNHGASDCTMNVGTTTQKFTVTSGSDTWWRSTDCQSQPSDMVVLIKAGQTVQSAAPIVWDRTRSSVSTCTATTRPKAPGGGASYHLAVEIGGIASGPTSQFILY